MKPVAVVAKEEEIKKAINDYYGFYRTISIALELENETKIKILSKLDISEHRILQSGRIDMKIDNLLFDLRVSILQLYMVKRL